jgi:hypothetical protein
MALSRVRKETVTTIEECAGHGCCAQRADRGRHEVIPATYRHRCAGASTLEVAVLPQMIGPPLQRFDENIGSSLVF